jgi:hypothetical protein
MKTGWEDEDPNNFLRILEKTSVARQWCREFIHKHARSVLEIGCGGLNERRGLSGWVGSYTGTDATWQFVQNGLAKFPDDDWIHVDVNHLLTKVYEKHDVVYSQHVLEHCPGIGLPLSNMLRMARKHVLNIFFMNPADDVEMINWNQYPRYHNTYSKTHIGTICEAHGFYHEFKVFHNTEYQHTPRTDRDPPIPARETVLIATRKEQ